MITGWIYKPIPREPERYLFRPWYETSGIMVEFCPPEPRIWLQGGWEGVRLT